jgi:hypothetical protein
VAITPVAVEGSYSCVGTGLQLTFTGGPSELVYTLEPAAGSSASTAPTT